MESGVWSIILSSNQVGFRHILHQILQFLLSAHISIKHFEHTFINKNIDFYLFYFLVKDFSLDIVYTFFRYHIDSSSCQKHYPGGNRVLDLLFRPSFYFI